ncbi:MAG TPA: peptidoglycan-binding domain-containing protein [Gemmatimonadales bacterium]|nr:peptidoglycan-binding domain-containing protein [Gemmatimonadales bacterium]
MRDRHDPRSGPGHPEALGQAGQDPGSVDGIIGTGTMRAVNAYQRAKGLPVDPCLTVATVKSLGIALH